MSIGNPARQSSRGFSVVELLISFVVFSIAMAVLAVTFVASQRLLAETTGSSDASQQLRRAYLNLEREIRSSAFDRVRVQSGPAAPGPGFTGDVVWFLSAEDPLTGIRARGSNGRSLWQRNILYYTAIPTNHSALYGFNCAGGANSEGYDVYCPHKVLIRKVIDHGPATTPTNESSEETLIDPADIGTYLSAPTGFAVPLSGAGTQQATVVAPSLLTFRASKAPIVAAVDQEISFRLQATSLIDLGKSVAVGSTDLERAPQTESMDFSVFPENP